MKRTIVLTLLGCLGLAGAVGFLAARTGTETRYLTAPVERGPLRDVVVATGRVDALGSVDVSSQLSGRVVEVAVDFNDVVTAGQLLARLDPEEFEARVREAEADLEVAGAAVRIRQAEVQRAGADIEAVRIMLRSLSARVDSARARLDEVERDLERKRALGAAVSRQALGEAESSRDATAADLRSAQAEVDAQRERILVAEAGLLRAQAELADARARVPKWQAILDLARVALERTSIRAPIDGVVIGRRVEAGQTVAASLEAPTLFTIAHELADIVVHVRVDETDIGRIDDGQQALFTVDSHPERVFAGRVTQIRKMPERQSGIVTYTVVVGASNPDRDLLPGMTALVRVVVLQTDEVLKIPNAALRYRPDGDSTLTTTDTASQVFVLGEAGQPRALAIQTGVSDAAYTELVSGDLEEGSSLVVGSVAAVEGQGVLGLRLGF